MTHMKSIALLFVLAGGCCVYTAQAQQPERNLLSHFSRAQVAQALIPLSQWHPFPHTPTEWRNAIPDTLQQKIINEAEKLAPIPFQALPATLMLEYVRTGNRSHYESISFKKRENLFTLSLAEAIEQKGRFTNAIVDGVWSICEESFWGVPAHLHLQNVGEGLVDVEDTTVELFVGETAGALALTDYLVGNKLDSVSPLLRKRIYYETNRRFLLPLEKENKQYWYFSKHSNNWNPWITSNWMLSLLLLEKNEQRRATELHHAMTLTDLYLNEIGADGAIDEGPGYWFDAVGRLFDGLSVIESATNGRISLFNETLTQLLGSYIYKTHIGGNYFVSIADAYPRLYPDGLMLYRFGKAVNDTNLQNFGAYFFHKGGDFFANDEFTMTDRLWDFTAMKDCDKKNGSEPLLKDVWLKSIELMMSRTDKGLFIASHGGHNAESHNHNDVGDVVLYAYGEPVVIDVGSGTYTSQTFSADRYKLWYNSSAYHNLPLINGYQQKEGGQFKAKDVNYSTTVAKTELRMDIADAYPAEARIKQWLRTVSAEKKSNRLVVKDSYVASSPLTSLTQTFMTVCPVDLQQPGKIFFEVAGKKVLLEYDSNGWDVTKEEALQHTPDEKRLEDNWSHKTIWRLLLTCKKLSAKGSFTYTFSMAENK
ncbi:MAG: heparinase II/III family protein [Ginsengibacter sp.]